MTRPRLALTLGDPAGVGPEVVARVVRDAEARAAADLVVVGPPWALERAQELVGTPDGSEAAPTLEPVHAEAPVPDLGQGCAAGGAWAIATVERAAELAEAGTVEGVVTAPVSKAAIHQAGHATFIGHTEYFGRRTNTPEPTMFFWSPHLCVALVTVHCALREVPARLTAERIAVTIDRTAGILRALDVPAPRLGVCGLNPHAGEEGLFGSEDAAVIAPVVERARSGGLTIEGPLPADTAFMRAGRGDFDALVAMYHDQGLGPFKLVAFESGVNVTLGLPYVRTSVDHGTAFDIAGRGTADASSLKTAVLLAARLVHARTPAG